MEQVGVLASGARRLKYYIHDHSHSFRLQLLGYLTASDLSELEGCWQTAKPCIAGRKIQLDLRGLAGADTAGQHWLGEMAGSEGLEVLASAKSANLLIPGINVVLGQEGGPGKRCWVDRLKILARTGQRASVPQEAAEAAIPDRAVSEAWQAKAPAQ